MGGWMMGLGATAGSFLVLDLIWLTTAVPLLYRPALGDLLADKVNYPAAAAFYIIYVIAVFYLAVMSGVRTQSVMTAVIAGAVFGLAAYAAYDLSNLATMKVWSLKVTIIDMAWGTFATASAAGIGCWAVLRAS